MRYIICWIVFTVFLLKVQEDLEARSKPGSLLEEKTVTLADTGHISSCQRTQPGCASTTTMAVDLCHLREKNIDSRKNNLQTFGCWQGLRKDKELYGFL